MAAMVGEMVTSAEIEEVNSKDVAPNRVFIAIIKMQKREKLCFALESCGRLENHNLSCKIFTVNSKKK
ncbi:MAG: hypothetical protein QNJ46_26405 [Leptolyngbyaceae cyanobacterium MO_188.B28]|nr:hypothetical protein [Leptolyngbyaceae cyanobacterium MO_188.B28]